MQWKVHRKRNSRCAKSIRNHLLSFIMIALAIVGFPLVAEGTTFETTPMSDVRIDGNRAVWMANPNQNWDIYMMDLTTGQQEQITNDPAHQSFPDIWGDFIVYMDNRAYVDDEVGPVNHDIYLYNIKSKEEQKISQTEGYHSDPQIADGKVVWVDQSLWKTVMLYDITTGELQRISSEHAIAFGVQFDGKHIVWMDLRDGEVGQIFIYDVNKGVEEQITYSYGHKVDPLLSDGKIVWLENHNGTTQLYMYIIDEERTKRVTAGPKRHRHLAMSGDSLILVKGDKLVISNTNTIVPEPIAQPGGGIPNQVFFDGEEVIWYTNGQLITESLTDAKARGIKYEQSTGKDDYHAPIYDWDRETEPKLDEHEKTYLVKKDETVTIMSVDKIMQLTINAGTFDQDVHITISQQPLEKRNDYIPISLQYKWSIEDNLKPMKPFELSIQYASLDSNLDQKKIGIYEINEIHPSYAYVPAVHDKTTSTLTTVFEGYHVSLMIYDRTFPDITNHWGKDYIEVLASHHMINGYEDQTFRPDRSMTRAEFVKLLVSSMEDESLNQAGDGSARFIDVPTDFWGYAYIEYAGEKGWINGFNGYFNPNDPITREEMITILMRVMNIEEESPSDILEPFTDKEHISSWAQEHIGKAVELGLIEGNDNKLNPKENATRAETSALFYRFLEKQGRF